MAADGGGGAQPLMKKEEAGLFGESNKKLILPQNNNNINNSRSSGGISIAERRAAKCGFNASNINSDPAPHLPSPFFTMPSGISPSALLDSPVMLPNAQAQLSPTTGTFQFPSPNHDQTLKLKLKFATNGDETIAIDQSSSKLHKPLFDEAEYSRGDVQEMSKRECLENKVAAKTHQVLGHKSNSCRESNIIINSRNNNVNQIMSKMSGNSNSVQELSGSTVHHNPNDHQEKVNKGGSSSYVAKEMAKYSEDGFFWRKYGQKHVKGSEFPRSYYRCTDTNCDVRKKVECSQDGQITEIVYKGSHNHPKPHNSSGGAPDQDDTFIPDNGGPLSFLNDLKDPEPRLMSMLEPPIFCIQDGGGDGADQNGASPDSISLNDEDDDQNAECDQPKKRECVPNETVVPRSTREPKVVVQIESDIDILDDGYKWRKYGQKVVKGNPNPRSYYKCTTPNCSVRKHVERAAEDIKSVITTYEGKHNHHVPCTTKTTNHPNSDAAAAININNKNINNNNDAPIPKSGNKVDLPSLFNMEAKANLNNYGNEMMNPNLPPPAGNFCAGTSSSSSSVYQPAVSLPPYHSMHYSSFMRRNSNYGMNSINYSTKLCPTYPDYMQLHYSQMNNINHISAPGTNHHQQQHVPLVATHYYHNNNYPTMQTPTRGQEQSRDNCQSKIVKPKEEPKG
ncbi:hypothetical protein ACP275_06G211600 [Erythranthe tilingii]